MKEFCKFTMESPAASYMPLPRFLFQDEALRDITNDAKVLYAMLLDRASISKQNGYVEPDGTIRLYFTVDRHRNGCIAAGNASQGSSGSWNTAASLSGRSRVLADRR